MMILPNVQIKRDKIEYRVIFVDFASSRNLSLDIDLDPYVI